MSSNQYQILNIVKTLDECNNFVKQRNVSKHRTSNLPNVTKYSHRCSNYGKYSLRKLEIQVYIKDNHPATINVYNAHCHEQRTTKTRTV